MSRVRPPALRPVEEAILRALPSSTGQWRFHRLRWLNAAAIGLRLGALEQHENMLRARSVLMRLRGLGLAEVDCEFSPSLRQAFARTARGDWALEQAELSHRAVLLLGGGGT